jgi:hypothetical protein
MAKIQNKRELIEKCVAIKSMPHVFDNVKRMWGYPEFFEYVDNLLMVEEGREGRQGFPEGIYREIAALKRLFMEFPEEIMAPELNDQARRQVYKIIEEIKRRSSFMEK